MSGSKFVSIVPYFLKNTDINDSSDLSFKVISYGKSFTLFPSTIKEKQEWMNMLDENIRDCKKNAIQQQETAPIWIPDELAVQCMLCKKDFSMFSRRHHCRKCGAVVCGDCSGNKAIVPGVDIEKEVRVCDECKKIL